jgi:MoxR-like ATPase
MTQIQTFVRNIIENVETVIIGKRDTLELLMAAMLVEGHVLLEDVPGVGKTMMARAIAASIGGQFKRLQCTPDLLPNDVTGVSIFNQGTGDFEFREGPIFVNILLTDEINRATPRTQSALLEAMQEQQVTVDGETRKLPRPFLVLATQNPIEYEGTFPLPEAQLDRFLMRLTLGYPNHTEEKAILQRLRREHPISSVAQVVDGAQILAFQKEIWNVHVDDTLENYIVSIVGATRTHPDLALGISPRGSLALYKTAQAYAALQGRDHVLPDDIKTLIPFTLAHRLIVRPEAELRGRTAQTVLQSILDDTPLDIGELDA